MLTSESGFERSGRRGFANRPRTQSADKPAACILAYTLLFQYNTKGKESQGLFRKKFKTEKNGFGRLRLLKARRRSRRQRASGLPFSRGANLSTGCGKVPRSGCHAPRVRAASPSRCRRLHSPLFARMRRRMRKGLFARAQSSEFGKSLRACLCGRGVRRAQCGSPINRGAPFFGDGVRPPKKVLAYKMAVLYCCAPRAVIARAAQGRVCFLRAALRRSAQKNKTGILYNCAAYAARPCRKDYFAFVVSFSVVVVL